MYEISSLFPMELFIQRLFILLFGYLLTSSYIYTTIEMCLYVYDHFIERGCDVILVIALPSYFTHLPLPVPCCSQLLFVFT